MDESDDSSFYGVPRCDLRVRTYVFECTYVFICVTRLHTDELRGTSLYGVPRCDFRVHTYVFECTYEFIYLT